MCPEKKMLELCAVKVACAVLREGDGVTDVSLPDSSAVPLFGSVPDRLGDYYRFRFKHKSLRR